MANGQAHEPFFSFTFAVGMAQALAAFLYTPAPMVYLTTTSTATCSTTTRGARKEVALAAVGRRARAEACRTCVVAPARHIVRVNVGDVGFVAAAGVSNLAVVALPPV